MENVTISLPAVLREAIDAQVADGKYGDASEYICSLIERDVYQNEDPELEAKLLKGLEGPGTVVTNDWWEQFRQRIIDRHRTTSKA